MSAILPPEVSASDRQWFDEANNKVPSQIDGLGDDPPFVLDNVDIRMEREHDDSLAPEDPILSYMRSSGWETENEELRGVIDDLTLDVKRLKRKLRRYREANPRHLQDDKLFELRTHRLSVQRKRQLESILQRFVDDISLPPRLSNDRPLSKTNSPPSDDNCMEILTMMIECLCSPDISRRISNLEPKFLHGTQEGWFSINEVLRCVQLAASAITQHKFSTEALKRLSSCIVVSGDGKHLRWKLATESSIEAGPTQNTSGINKQNSDKLQTSSLVPFGNGGLMSTANKSAFYTPSPFLQHTGEDELDTLSMTNSNAESVQQFTVVNPNLHVPESRSLSSNAHSGKTVYYRNSSFYLDYSWDDLELSEHRQSLQQYDKEQNRRRPSEEHISNRFAVYQTDHNGDSSMHYDPSSPGLSLNEESVSPTVSLAGDGAKRQPIEFEASGVGNVVPDDNFAVHVTVRHTPAPGAHHGQYHAATQPPENRLSKHRITTRPDNSSTLNAHIVASTWENLAPSSLPPPTYGIFSIGSSDDEDDKSSPSDPSYRGGYGVDKPTHATSIQEWRAAVFSSLRGDTASSAGGPGDKDAEALL